MGILSGLIIQWVSLSICILIEVVVGCLGIKSVLIWILSLILRWWSGLMVGILSMGGI